MIKLLNKRKLITNNSEDLPKLNELLSLNGIDLNGAKPLNKRRNSLETTLETVDKASSQKVTTEHQRRTSLTLGDSSERKRGHFIVPSPKRHPPSPRRNLVMATSEPRIRTK
eukprot:UN25473